MKLLTFSVKNLSGLSAVLDALEACHWPRYSILGLILDELVTNFFSHVELESEITLRIRQVSTGSIIFYCDHAPHFDPTQKRQRSEAIMEYGGHGLVMVQHFASTFHWRALPRGNAVRIRLA